MFPPHCAFARFHGCRSGWLLTQASKSVDTVNVHGARTANTLSARAAESESWVDFVLDADERIQHHRTGLVEVQSVSLHAWLLGWGVWVPSVDVEGLDLSILGWCWLWSSAGLRLWSDWSGGGRNIVGADRGKGANASRSEGRARRGGEHARGGTESGHFEELRDDAECCVVGAL